MLMRVVAAGFDGLLIDDRGFAPAHDPKQRLGAAEVITEINQNYAEVLVRPVAQLPEIRHLDRQQFFLDLRPFRDAYSPEVALMLMWTEMRQKFDPELLQVFMRVMAIQPVKVLSKRQQNMSLAGL